MRLLVQRSLNSSVQVENKVVGKIEKGLVVLVGFTEGDTSLDIDFLIHKLTHLRIFDDENGIMNQSILDNNESVLSISQFTLYANTEKGNRPSYQNALTASQAELLYREFNQKLETYVPVSVGIFGEHMKVTITNDGPVTILLESRLKYDKK